ncbi:TRAP transporter small permease, partial [Desulfovibrio sp. OttesenSCG-928-I05]|nr:TRAP transporter small permease [Desulfovibrio sp. OttesenSCG-928-I05]MDL2272671.1 TRAP transporter small permease [Desulfovibrio sp. OttesenSCG-928-I05]
KLLRWLDLNFERVIGGISLGIVVVLIFIGVVIRVVFNAGLPWQEELSRVLFVFSLYLGASYGVRCNDHIRVTIVRDLLPEGGKRVLGIITDIMWIGFNIAVIWYCCVSLVKMSAFPALSAYLAMDTRIPFAIIPVLTGLQTIRLFQAFYMNYIRKTPLAPDAGGPVVLSGDMPDDIPDLSGLEPGGENGKGGTSCI